jgi:uncharacterized membrane protein
MKNLIRFLTISLSTGIAYMGIEMLWRGKTHWSMMIVAGLSVYLIGLLDEDKRLGFKVYQQSLIGALIATSFEFISGVIVNLILGWHVWDYSNQFGNIFGQICPLFSFFWLLIVPIGIWMDNLIRYKLFDEEKCDSLIGLYIKLFTLK